MAEMSEMDAAHRRDYAQKWKLDDARKAVLGIINEVPMSTREKEDLERAAHLLTAHSNRIVRAWD